MSKQAPPYNPNNKAMFWYLIVLAAVAALGFQGWRTLLNNFAVETVGISGEQMGVVQGMREVPGFLAFVVIYVLYLVREHHLAAGSLLVMGLGVLSTGLFPSYGGLIFTTMVMSFGFHYYETVNQSLTVQHFSVSQVPLVLGRVRAVMSAANIVAGGLIIGLSYLLSYAAMFWVVGGLVAVVAFGAIFVNPTPKETTPQVKKFLLRKRYWLFYALTFMAGARRQIFVAFAVFLLVSRFQFTIQEVAILFVVNNVINYWVAPWVGRAINRFGERPVLSTEYLGLIIVFAVYAFTDSKALAAAAYVVDHMLFGCGIAIQSYFRKIADPGEVAPSMAVGFTINHIVAVGIPIVGGMLWMVDYRITFLGGAAMALVSLVLSQFTTRTSQPQSAP